MKASQETCQQTQRLLNNDKAVKMKHETLNL